MRVRVNDDERELPDGQTLGALLAQLGFADRPVAVELNRELVPRARHADTVLRAGDRVEIVTLVGGG